ncbi:MAG: OmpH family outer membrane protein [Nitrospirota bacterium]|nr:OmpH family outer membrane protein [Nitrospirota bacterium]MDH5585787.1 OmpH family outer membrane protein [Nitrospirota bacterium]MDH5773830.1 OmpH family outer membrane protein [Nitrospirota bacterium]
MWSKVFDFSSIRYFFDISSGWLILPLLLSVASISCAPIQKDLQSNLIVGVVDPQRILLETTKGKRLSEALNAFMKDRQLLVELEQKELRELEEEIRAQRTVLSESARALKEEQFRQKMGGYQQKVADLSREVQEKQRELQNEFRRQVGLVVTEIAKARNLGLVLEHGPNSGTLFYEESWDISAEVIQALNQKSDAPEIP